MYLLDEQWGNSIEYYMYSAGYYFYFDYLSSQGIETLQQTTATATCVAGTAWDGVYTNTCK